MFPNLPVDGPVIISFVVVGFILAFLLAFGVGANDVANFFGTVVGTNTLKLWQVFIIASIFELSGSILLGFKVSDTVRKNIANISDIPILYPLSSNCRRPITILKGSNNLSITSDVDENMRTCADIINMEISIGALLGSASWLAIANIGRLPVSTTHSIVGSTLGAGLVALGPKSIGWIQLVSIVSSWVLSPLISGLISSALYYSLYKAILKKPNSFDLCLKVVPYIYFITIFINIFSVVHKGSHVLKFDKIPLWGVLLLSFGIAICVFLLTIFVINPYTKRKINEKFNQKIAINNNSKFTTTPLSSTDHKQQTEPKYENINTSAGEIDNEVNGTNVGEIKVNEQLTEKVQPSNVDSQDMCVKENSPTDSPNDSSDAAIEICDDAQRGCKDPRTNMLFHILQVIMACFGAFVHGGNDISNSISPLMNIWLTFKEGNITEKSRPPLWLLVYGSAGMIIGLVILGKRVISTIGKKITKISPASGFTIEFGSAFTVLIATKLSLPISTTHCQIGSVIAVGMIRNGRKSVNFKLILNIVISWLVTLPVSGLISAATFAASREIVAKINL